MVHAKETEDDLKNKAGDETPADEPEKKPSGESDANEDDKNNGEDEKTLSKAEAQKMADAIVAKKLKGMPTKEELAEYKKWQDSQKTAEEKRAEEQKRYAAIESENTTLKRERSILDAGVKLDDVDYVLFKVQKMDGEFDDNLAAFLESNPKYLSKNSAKISNDGVPAGRGSEGGKANGVREALQKRHPELKF